MSHLAPRQPDACIWSQFAHSEWGELRHIHCSKPHAQCRGRLPWIQSSNNLKITGHVFVAVPGEWHQVGGVRGRWALWCYCWRLWWKWQRPCHSCCCGAWEAFFYCDWGSVGEKLSSCTLSFQTNQYKVHLLKCFSVVTVVWTHYRGTVRATLAVSLSHSPQQAHPLALRTGSSRSLFVLSFALVPHGRRQ